MDQAETDVKSASRPSPVKVRRLGHIVLQVSDVERSIKFYTEVLNFRVSDRQESGGAFLTGIGDHHTIGLFRATDPDAPKAAEGAVRLNHFALQVGSLDELFEIRAWLKERGIPLNFEGRRRLGGHTSVEFADPDGYHVELFCDMDQLAPGQRSRPVAPGPQLKSLEASRDNPKPSTW
jgi:catechol 2,3-dioxygenase-like lactoylglutathione lyase family enzyme